MLTVNTARKTSAKEMSQEIEGKYLLKKIRIKWSAWH